MVVMPKKTQPMQQKATQDATSGQDRVGVFRRIKAYSRHKVRAVGTLVAATALVWALNTRTAKAQDYTLISNDSKNKLENTVEGPKIYGTKTFAVQYDRGILYLDSVSVDEKYFSKFQTKVEKADEMGIGNCTNSDVKAIYFTKFEGRDNIAYLIFENGILAAKPRATRTEGGADYSYVGSSADKIFFDAIFIAPNGSILATTPKILLGITPDRNIAYSYKGMFGDEVLDLTKPSFSQGRETDIIDLRDATFTDGKTYVKIEINVSKFKATVVEDKHPIGGGN